MKTVVFGVVGAACILILLGLYNRFALSEDVSYLRIGPSIVAVELKDTVAERRQGLSGRKGLAEGEGMFFIFDEPALYPFWMKDMNFAIDIIWFDSSFKVITIHERVDPNSYPKQFTPSQPAQFVLEVPAGWAAAKGIKIGDFGEIF